MAKTPPRTAYLSISIPVELVQALYQAVRSGEYPSDDAVVCEALRRMLTPDAEDPKLTMQNPTERRRARREGK